MLQMSYLFEAAKTGKNQFWIIWITRTSGPSVWKLRKWIRALRKLLVLGSECMGPLVKTMTAISSTCTWRKQSNTKWGQIEMRDWLVVSTPLKILVSWDMLGWLFPICGKIKTIPNHQPDEICCNDFDKCVHSVKSVSLCRKSVGKSSAELPKTREVCDKFAGWIASRALNVGDFRQKNIEKPMDFEWIILKPQTITNSIGQKTYSMRC